MSEEIDIAGKSYVPSKQAALSTGYAQDYIGQLARGGLIDAQRVGGLWYVNLESLTGYKTNANEFKPVPPTVVPVQNPESVVSFDGKDYISASRAAKITSYNQDYIGQLARSGKILSRQIGNRWYIERSGLLAHKSEKDGLLAAVQRESVGLARPVTPAPMARPVDLAGEYAGAGPVLTYFKDENELIPSFSAPAAPVISPIKPLSRPEIDRSARTHVQRAAHDLAMTPNALEWHEPNAPKRSFNIGTKAVAALTIVIVLSYGLISLKDSSKYASNAPQNGVVSKNTYLAAAASGINALGNALEMVLTKDLTYIRPSSK